MIRLQRFQEYHNKIGKYNHNVFFPVDNLDLRKLAPTSRHASVKKGVYNLYSVVALDGYLNANKFKTTLLNQREGKWYTFEEDETVAQSHGVESPS